MRTVDAFSSCKIFLEIYKNIVYTFRKFNVGTLEKKTAWNTVGSPLFTEISSVPYRTVP